MQRPPRHPRRRLVTVVLNSVANLEEGLGPPHSEVEIWRPRHPLRRLATVVLISVPELGEGLGIVDIRQ